MSIQTHVEASEISLEKQLELSQLIAEISRQFFSLKVTDDEKTINDALAMVGKYIGADRIYIFTYDFKQKTCSNTYEWCNDNILPFINDLQNVPLTLINPWVQAHLNHESIYIPRVKDLDPSSDIYQILEPQNIKSLLAVPMFNEDECYGFLGIDSVSDSRLYTTFEQKALQQFSNLLLGVLNREELRQSIHILDTTMRSILDSQHELVCRLDQKGIIIYSNDAFNKLLKNISLPLIGRSIFDVAPMDTHWMLDQLIHHHFTYDENHRYTYQILDVAGQLIWIEWEAYPIIVQNDIEEFQLVGRDFSETKKAEAELNKERIKLNALIDSSQIGTFEWDIPQDIILINDHYSTMLGYTKDELMPYTFIKVVSSIHPDFTDEMHDRINDLLEKRSKYFSMDVKFRQKDGNYRWIRTQGTIATWSSDGKPLIMYGVHIDLSVTKANEERLHILEQAIESSPTSAVITNAEGIIQYVNPMFTKMTGYTAEEAIGNTPRVLKSGYHSPSYYKQLWDVIKSGKIWRGEFYNKRKDGSYYWELASIAPILDNKNRVTHYVATKYDISEKKRYEVKLQEYNKQLESDVSDKIQEIAEAQRSSALALARLTESRDYTTGQHVDRVQYFCRALTEALMNDERYHDYITPGYVDDIFYASVLHDIGKVGIPDAILLKPGRLTPEEFEIMKTHVDIGAKTLSDISRDYPKNRIMEMGIQIAKYHHEKWNGKGYQEGLSGEQIPLSARIMAIVDAYDAIRSKRPYKDELSHEEAMRRIIQDAGEHFDPYIVEVLQTIEDQFIKIYNQQL